MSNRLKQRHYRVVQKEVETDPSKGLFVPHCMLHKCIIGAVILVLGIFVKGMLLGYLIGRDD